MWRIRWCRALRCLRQVVLLCLLPAMLSVPAEARGETIPDWAVPQGHFYTQTNGIGPQSDLGYAVVDDEVAAFWTAFQRFGGLRILGYPVSQRFLYHGLPAQAFQKAIILWNPITGQGELVNVFDEFSLAGHDPFLAQQRFIPLPLDWSADAEEPWGEIRGRHLALLDQHEALKAAYYAVTDEGYDPVQINGLPMGFAHFGPVIVLRAQRRAFQLWQVDTPWARTGMVTVVNSGDLAKEVGLVPEAAQRPLSAPVPPFGFGDAEQGARLYTEKACALCHGVRAEGGLGPPLAATPLTFLALLQVVRTPQEEMPPYAPDLITDQEVRDIYEYLRVRLGDNQRVAP